jgi:hypothetical protein
VKKSILFVLVGGPDKASSRVRGYWIAEELEKLNYSCSMRSKNAKVDMILAIPQILRHDIIIFQKTCSRYHRWLMKLAKLAGKSVYMDIDDFPSRNHNIQLYLMHIDILHIHLHFEL